MTQLETPQDLRPLTALRFGAAVWVALFAFWPDLDVSWMPNLVAKGYLGVALFFVLSGFILSHVYLAAHGEKRFSYGSFLWARIARVYPLHIATLIGVGVLALGALAAGMDVNGNILSWQALPANILMVHAWGFAPVAGWNHPSWSISAEWFAYLSFPVFAFVAWKLRERPFAAVIGAVAFLVALYAVFEMLAGFPLTRATILWGALRIVPCFALGCALYLVHRKMTLPRPGVIAGGMAIIIAVAASLQAPDALIVPLCGGLILALASLSNAKAGWLASRPAVYLGEISYSVYMVVVPWKLLAVNAASKLTGGGDKLQLFVWLAVILTLPVVAAISYHLVEFPARRALRDLARRRAERAKARTGDPQLA
ncbi:acyltransferase [Brevundimonas sp.]|uniref:acyltransferase family protein n=1 Tax=Brevundimonas sp. TaxID=1871086 RepID=UPI0025BE522E|nr:acyltransferase [Brevundimonas sp.]MCG2663964.1 acyltransferase [Brevundimonas sp.]